MFGLERTVKSIWRRHSKEGIEKKAKEEMGIGNKNLNSQDVRQIKRNIKKDINKIKEILRHEADRSKIKKKNRC